MSTVHSPLLEVRGLKTHFTTSDGVVRAVDGVDLHVAPGETLCLVGESGCGKSVTARSILRLVERPGQIVAGQLNYRPEGADAPIDLATLDPRGEQLRAIRGSQIAMVFQEPMVALSPVHTIGNQIVENIRLHERIGKKQARERAIEELRRVGIPRPEQRVDAYTFQLSGGMRQRAMIALALSCRPRLLIADEPTTALDVTTQAQILQLLHELQEQLGMAIIFITHDLGVVAEIADRVAVMYLGLVVEDADVDSIFHAPQHPYTQALLRSLPTAGQRHRRLPTIQGMVPHPSQRPTGCPFHPRCDRVIADRCSEQLPELAAHPAPPRAVRCLLYDQTRPDGATRADEPTGKAS